MELEKLNQWIQSLTSENNTIYQVFIIVFSALLLNFFWKKISLRLQKQLERTNNHWDDSFLKALSRPISLLIWGIGSWIILVAIFNVEVDVRYRDSGLAVIVGWALVRFIREAEQNLVAHNKVKSRDDKLDPSTVEALSKLLRAAVSITVGLVVLQTMGISISAVLAFGGMGGIAIGFAARDLLANFFGGLTIYLDRPFAVGDWIRSPDRSIEGTVEYIGWRQTRIRTFDKRPLYVPNNVFANIIVENPSRMNNRRIYETIGLRYDDIAQIDTVVKSVKEMLRSHPEIDNNQTLIVNFNAFNDSSVDFFVYTFTRTTDWVKFHEIKQQILLEIAAIIERSGADIAYPTQRLLMEGGPGRGEA